MSHGLAMILAAFGLGGAAFAAEPVAQVQRVEIPLRDGVALVADVYLPAGEGAFPTIVEVTPYVRSAGGGYADEADYWTAHGYALLVADARGQGESEGEFGFFFDAGADNFDVIEWAAAQPWSTGAVGMRGSSYTGASQWYAAVQNPPSLKCIAPHAVTTRPSEELVRVGGALKLRWAAEWLAYVFDDAIDSGESEASAPPVLDYEDILHQRPLIDADQRLFGRRVAMFRDFLIHDALSEYWAPINLEPLHFSNVDIPTFSVSGWFDGTLVGTSYAYRMAQNHAPADEHAFLVVGPWEHSTAPVGGYRRSTGQPVTQVGEIAIPEHGFMPILEVTRVFYDWCLKGEGSFDNPNVQLFLTGSNRWISAEYYPPEHDVQALYLQSGEASAQNPSGLSWTPAPLDAEPSRFVYDPGNPVPEYVLGEDGEQIRLQSTPADIRSIQNRPDVLVFETEPLEQPLTVVGPVSLMLHVASSALDTDFTSHIADVHPDGRAIKLGPQSGANARARYRHGPERSALLTPNQPFEIELSYFDIGHTFLPGHKIRVSITSSNYPWISANPNTGNPIATDTAEPILADQTVFNDAVRRSRLMLPVVNAERY